MTSAWWTRRSIMAAATPFRPKTPPPRPKNLLLVAITVAGLAGSDRQAGGQVGLAVPGGPRKTTFSFAVTKSRVPRWAMTSRLRPRAWPGVELLQALAGREAGGA